MESKKCFSYPYATENRGKFWRGRQSFDIISTSPTHWSRRHIDSDDGEQLSNSIKIRLGITSVNRNLFTPAAAFQLNSICSTDSVVVHRVFRVLHNITIIVDLRYWKGTELRYFIFLIFFYFAPIESRFFTETLP